MTDIAFAPDGRLFGLDFDTLYEIDPRTAETTPIGNHGIPSGNALVFAADGTLYGMGGLSSQLFELDPATGAATALGDVGEFSAGDLAFYGGELYLSTSAHRLQHIELGPPATGADVGAFGFSNVYGLATSDAGVLYGIAGTEIFTVDPTTGAGTLSTDYAGQGLDVAYGSSFQGEAFQACPLTPVAGCEVVSEREAHVQGKGGGAREARARHGEDRGGHGARATSATPSAGTPATRSASTTPQETSPAASAWRGLATSAARSRSRAGSRRAPKASSTRTRTPRPRA